MMQGGAKRGEAALAELVAQGASAASIADSACGMWTRVFSALAPILGQQGVAALFRRSLHLTRSQHPVLSAINDDGSTGNFASLRAALSHQTNSEAARTHNALLGNFHDLLFSLVGEALTERLLAPVWDNRPDPDLPQEPSS